MVGFRNFHWPFDVLILPPPLSLSACYFRYLPLTVHYTNFSLLKIQERITLYFCFTDCPWWKKHCSLLMRDNHLDMMKHLCSPIASCWFCASMKTIIWRQYLSSVGQWFPTDPVMWQWSANIGPDLHSVMAEGYEGREETPGQRLVELLWQASPGQQAVVSHPSTLRKKFF